MTSPAATLKTVCRRETLLCSDVGSGFVTGGGGGGTENRARSWVSVSRINEVMSWLESRALVNIFGGGNLYSGCVSDRLVHCPGAWNLRKAVNALARHGDLLKVGGEERHDVCARLFSYSRQPRQEPGGSWLLLCATEAFASDDYRARGRDHLQSHDNGV